MNKAFFTLRVPNPLYWLRLRTRWRQFIIKKAIEHIAAVNKAAKLELLTFPYTDASYPAVDTHAAAALHSVPKRKAIR